MASSPAILVQKYGGSSVADVPHIHAVADRVVRTVREGHQVVVVVSAMGNTTNELLALARQVSPRPGRRELDLLVSVGERVSMTLLAMAIEDRGVPAASFTGSQSGIITDDQHVSARVEEVRPHRIRRALDEGRVAIVAGFQGVSRGGEVTTLGRGGSDTTAVVLAAALGAAWCELCSDVDGVFTADPRVVPGARRLDSLSLDAAAALAQAGSKVIAADAVELARSWGVQLVSSDTRLPSGSGTRLPPGPTPAEVVGVAADTQLALLPAAAPAGLVGLDGAVRAWVPGVGALVDVRNLHHDLGGEPVATVSAVGRRLVTTPAWTARALAALDGLPVRAWWATGEGFSALVGRAEADPAQRRLHAALVEPGPAPANIG
ncbi:aspartate kinase [Myxococcota bacterium]|nr:aspartate kinase [Myxococcota bacterium]